MSKAPNKAATEMATVSPAKEVALQTNESSAFEEFAGAGMEKVGAGDVLIPRIAILQALSPQLSPKKSEYIPEGKVGMICDLGTGELYSEGMVFLPVYYRRDYLEWAPRASGKGLVTIHDSAEILDRCVRDEKNRPFLPNGNLISETAQWFGLNMTGGGRKCFIPMGSTQLKRSRRWMTLATGEKLTNSAGKEYTPPLFYRTYLLSVAEESNNEGDWYGWKVDRGLSLPETGDNWKETMQVCVEFRNHLMDGRVRADLTDVQVESSEGTEGRM